jgi:hypothetical protein
LVVYPRAIYYDQELPTSYTAPGVPQPKIAGDLLITRNQAGYPTIAAASKDGATWTGYHPSRLAMNLTGAGLPTPDYPMQLGIGMASGKAKITHIANRSRAWVPVDEPVIPPGVGAERAKVYNAAQSALRSINPSVRITGTGIAQSNTAMTLLLGGSQAANRSTDVTYCYAHTVYKEGMYDYDLMGTVYFNGSGNTELLMTWDDSGNRVAANSTFFFEIDVAKLPAGVAFTTTVRYKRTTGGRKIQTTLQGYLYGANFSYVTWCGIKFQGAQHFVTHSHLTGNW